MTTIRCEICGADTPMLGTRRCDRCWELERRILAAPALARKILGDTTRITELEAALREVCDLLTIYRLEMNDFRQVETKSYGLYQGVDTKALKGRIDHRIFRALTPTTEGDER